MFQLLNKRSAYLLKLNSVTVIFINKFLGTLFLYDKTKNSIIQNPLRAKETFAFYYQTRRAKLIKDVNVEHFY